MSHGSFKVKRPLARRPLSVRHARVSGEHARPTCFIALGIGAALQRYRERHPAPPPASPGLPPAPTATPATRASPVPSNKPWTTPNTRSATPAHASWPSPAPAAERRGVSPRRAVPALCAARCGRLRLRAGLGGRRGCGREGATPRTPHRECGQRPCGMGKRHEGLDHREEPLRHAPAGNPQAIVLYFAEPCKAS